MQGIWERLKKLFISYIVERVVLFIEELSVLHGSEILENQGKCNAKLFRNPAQMADIQFQILDCQMCTKVTMFKTQKDSKVKS